MKTLEITKVKKSLSSYIKGLGNEVVLLTENQEPVAVLISLSNLNRESLLLSMNPDFLEIIEKARQEFKEGKKLSLDKMKAEVLK